MNFFVIAPEVGRRGKGATRGGGGGGGGIFGSVGTRKCMCRYNFIFCRPFVLAFLVALVWGLRKLLELRAFLCTVQDSLQRGNRKDIEQAFCSISRAYRGRCLIQSIDTNKETHFT